MSTTLRLIRKADARLMEMHRGPFEVVLDGDRLGTLPDQESFQVPIDAGAHTLLVRTGRWSSRIATFKAAEGEAVAFRYHGLRIWPILLASLPVPRLALKLIRE